MASVLPELVSYLEGLPEPHILLDRQYRILSANAAYRRQFSPKTSVIGRTCFEVSHRFEVPCDQAGESCPLARARESGQRERVLHLHHTPQGEAYVNIELVPLHDATGEHAYFIEKMEPLRVAQGQPAAQGLIGRAAVFQQMLELVARVGPSGASVLLLGESGTGKELVARAIHESSPRTAAPLVVVDCASLPETLFESELFGHERGAFTGADRLVAGRFEQASGGTLFLDEISRMPLPFQQKILRVVEYGTFMRIGGSHEIRSSARIVAASNADLEGSIRQGAFLPDLYDRLAFEVVRVPALRERQGDVRMLAKHFLAEFLREVPALGEKTWDEAALAALERHPFPGNVRELKTIVERAAYRDTTREINVEDLALPDVVAPHAGTFRERAEGFERQLIHDALSASGGNQADAARRLGLAYHRFRYYARKYLQGSRS